MTKILFSFLALIISFHAYGMRVGSYHFKSVWEGRGEFSGAKLIVVGVTGHGFTGDKLVLFQADNKINYFSLFSSPNFYTDTNTKFEGHGEYYKTVGRILRRNHLLSLTLIPSYGTKNLSGLFEKSRLDMDAVPFGNEVLAELDSRFQAVTLNESIKSIKDLKKVFLRLKDTMGYVVPNSSNFLYTVPYQQEQDWEMGLPNTSLRDVTQADSYLVDMFREADGWSTPRNRSASVVSYLRFDSSFSLGRGLLSKGAKRYIQHEIVNRWYFVCAGKSYWTEETIWLLTDGSFFRYSPTSDCQ